MAASEFTVEDAYTYDRRSAVRWLISHVLRYPWLLIGLIGGQLIYNLLNAFVPVLTGSAFTDVLQAHPDRQLLLTITLSILGIVLGTGALNALSAYCGQFLGTRMQRDAREELYLSLLGKSQTFHNRQRVGDIMARASNDTSLLNAMISPALGMIVGTFFTLAMSLTFIALLNPQLLVAPLLFTLVFAIVVYRYVKVLTPVIGELRGQFGRLNAGLTETVTGIEVVKSTAQEAQERRKFTVNARRYRDLFVRSGFIQGYFTPPLLLKIALAGGFLHGVVLASHHQLTTGGLITYIGLLGMLGPLAGLSSFMFNLLQMGVAAADRILPLLREEPDLSENEAGYRRTMRGEIVFEDVTFSYGGSPVLKNVSFRAEPGQTVAIVGQTGSGKSTLTKLVNRIYDVDAGRIVIDGVDVRSWSLESLRSQIATIEQDIFLFSRTIAENIAFGLGQQANRAAIEQAAQDAQAHGFISGFRDGYDTLIGERGVTLSGGQRQRLAIARALLTDPRLLILDDSTSAIDSATEDEIQKAMRRLEQGRTTLLITHRLSQIRWADKILVLRQGELVDQGTHDELMQRCDPYRRIFSHYDKAPAQPTPVTVQSVTHDMVAN